MRKQIPKITALTTMLVALVVAAYALKEPAREIWYLHQLQSEDQTTRVEAAFILAEMGCLKAILPLFKEMPIGYFSRDFHDLALRKFATPEAVPEFAKALKDPDPRIRREAVEYLQAIDTEPARTTLASHLEDDDLSVRQEIVSGLGRAGVKGVPFLVRALANSNDSTRLLALSSLKQLGPNARKAGDSLERLLLDASPDLYEEAKAVMVEIGMDLLPFCLSALASPDGKARLRAAEILTEPAQATERAGAAIPALRQLLLGEKEEEFDGSDYHTALESLFRASVQSAKVGLGDEDFRIRSLAASCLGDAATCRDQALSALVLALKDQDWRVRQAAAESLGYLEEDEAVLPLTAALADEAAGVRIAATEALGRFGPKARAAAPALLEALKSEDPEERKQAASTLGDIGGKIEGAVPSLRRLVEDPSPKVRIWAAYALARLGGDEGLGLPFLLPALTEFEDDLRACTAMAIGRIGRPARAAIPDLKKLLTDSSYFVRASAARALARMGVESLPVLLELIRPLNRTSPLELWHALNEMEVEPSLVPMLIGFLKDGMESLPEDLNWRLRSWAASRLGKLSLEARAAMPALVQALATRMRTSLLPRVARWLPWATSPCPCSLSI